MRSALIGEPGAFHTLRPLRVLIVDDSVVTRAVLTAGFEQDPDFEIIACVGGAEQALAILETRQADVVLLDLEMPGIDGFAALPRIRRQARNARIVVLAASCVEGSATSARALALGAAATYPKPAAREMGASFAAALRNRLRLIAASDRPTEVAARPVTCLALGASTGGVNALVELLRELPPEFDPPILVTQHLPRSFMAAFAVQLGEAGRRSGIVAAERMPLTRGRVHLAPGDAHLRVTGDPERPILHLDRRSAPSRCMPSVDPMLISMGEIYGAGAVGVILSGMGRDGLSGAAALVAAGGTVMVQDEESSVVWGMPGAIAAADLASNILAPREIARRLLARGIAA